MAVPGGVGGWLTFSRAKRKKAHLRQIVEVGFFMDEPGCCSNVLRSGSISSLTGPGWPGKVVLRDHQAETGPRHERVGT